MGGPVPGPAVVSIPGGEVLQRSPLASVVVGAGRDHEHPGDPALRRAGERHPGRHRRPRRCAPEGNSVDQHVDTPFGAVRCFGFLLDERSAFFAAQAVSSSSEAAADRAERTADALLTAASPDLQLLFDAELRIVHASEAVLAEVPGGAVLADLVGRRMRDVGVEEPEAVLVEADLREALESGLPLRRDGFFEGRLWDVVVAPVDPDGARLVMVSGRDITSLQASRGAPRRTDR